MVVPAVKRYGTCSFYFYECSKSHCSANAKETTIYLILHQHATLRSLIGPRSATLILVSYNVSDVSFD